MPRSVENGWILSCLVLLLCVATVGCSRDRLFKLSGYDRAGLLKKSLSPEDEALARDCVELLLQGRFDEIEDRLDPSIRSGDTRQHLAEMAYQFPSKPASVKTVEAGIVRSRDSSTSTITLEYEFSQSWLFAHFVIRTKNGIKTVIGFSVTPASEPIEEINEFTFDGKGISQYAGLFLLVWVAALTLYAFVQCARMKIGGTKWVWLVAISIGICRLSVNWTTGQWLFTPLSFEIPPVQATCTPYGPWMLQIWSPLGAIVFLRLRKSLVPEASPLSILPEPGVVNEVEGSTQ
jgi:hypothetical protein